MSNTQLIPNIGKNGLKGRKFSSVQSNSSSLTEYIEFLRKSIQTISLLICLNKKNREIQKTQKW